jgi:DNA-binding NarL/FixJ family response regulator
MPALAPLESPFGRTAARLGDACRLERLAPAELRVLELMAEGLSNCAIAERLVVSLRTVECHISHILLKLDLRWDTVRDKRVAAVLIYLDERPSVASEAVLTVVDEPDQRAE